MKEYRTSAAETLEKLQVMTHEGLTSQEARKRQLEQGPNKLRQKKPKTVWVMFLEQFRDFLVLILLIAAIVSIVTGLIMHEGLTDGIIILAIVIVNAVLGVSQEQKASKALDSLKKMTSPQARVIRDGRTELIDASDLVVGDIVYMESGDVIPADVRLIKAVNFQVSEAALTGESTPVEKDAALIYEKDVPLADRHNMGYMSTQVTMGKAYGVVVGIGMATEIGHIATMLDSVNEGKTPLQKSMDGMAKLLGIISILVSVAVFVLGFFQGDDVFELFLTSIALAVAAIPEGLTAVITVVLALGMQRMVRRHAIIKNLSTVETLGQATVICSDKTGTLTQNKMTVVQVYDMNRDIHVSGTGYSVDGRIEDSDLASNRNLKWILDISMLCNNAGFDESKNVLGDPTEAALLILAEKGGISKDRLLKEHPQVNEYPFDSERKLMSSVNRYGLSYAVLTKGAADRLLKKSAYRLDDKGEKTRLSDSDKKEIARQADIYSEKAYRVLGFAYKMTDSPQAEDPESDLIFVGLTAMIDPPREEAKAAIDQCHKAGIRVMMITGDHLVTASAIAGELDILQEGHIVLSGEKAAEMSDEEYEKAILKCDVFARSSPRDKLRIVDILQRHGEVVAMTGDGVNDSPALKQADIGIAMGITGTEVSKEASNMILTDDNFASIVSAVREGRIIYQNIRKFTSYLISCNLGEIFIVFFAMLFGFLFKNIMPLLAIHLLWINLLTDSFPAFALGVEKEEAGIMDTKPRGAKAPLIDGPMLAKMIIQGFGLAAAALISFYLGLNVFGADEAQARTMIFVTVVLGELLRAYSARSESLYVFQMNPFGNRTLNIGMAVSLILLIPLIYIPAVAGLFRMEGIFGLDIILTAVGLGFVPLLIAELSKWLHQTAFIRHASLRQA